MCNGKSSSVLNFDSIVSFFLAKDTIATMVTFGHKNETTGIWYDYAGVKTNPVAVELVNAYIGLNGQLHRKNT